MAKNRKPRTVLFRRRREQKTDYKRRLSLLKSGKMRIVIRLTNQRIISQLVQFTTTGDNVLVAIDSFSLKKLGWKSSCKNIPAAYLTGLLVGKKVLEKGEKEAILDTGLVSPLKKSRIYAFLKGVLDAGLQVPNSSEEIFPDEKRIAGEHLKTGGKDNNFTDIKNKING
jgi:large subunit ribosomal protein L18